jgi:hypothetical protein
VELKVGAGSVTSRRVIEELARATETALQILRDQLMLLQHSEQEHRAAAAELTEEVQRRGFDEQTTCTEEWRNIQDDA